MTLPLTPHILAGCYDFLRTTPPYCRWKLPEPDEVAFVVSRNRAKLGTHQGGVINTITVSEANAAHTCTLVWIMGHEMIHLAQFLGGHETPNTIHNADFRRKAQAACRYHGWDIGLFL